MFIMRRTLPFVKSTVAISIGGNLFFSSAAKSPSYMDEGCSMCNMMKAGPCKEIFLPFEACLDKCIEDGIESSDKCKELFQPVMDCLFKHKAEYDIIMAKMKKEAEEAEEKEGNTMKETTNAQVEGTETPMAETNRVGREGSGKKSKSDVDRTHRKTNGGAGGGKPISNKANNQQAATTTTTKEH